MELILSTDLWQNSLGKTDWPSGALSFVERLRQSFILFREHATQFAKHLSEDLRQLTIHDETHTDALWEVFDVVFPVEIVANPLEAYVLGGAFLIHDLGHALCMYPGGIDELKGTEAWRRAKQFAARSGGIDQSILENAIRLNHAAHAQTLALKEFGKSLYLIDDAELRNYLGSTIGQVAYSHWWDHKQLNDSPCLATIGAIPLPDCPGLWTIEPRKLSYILRVCDACQIDGRRAPIFSESLRKPKGVSSDHWGAQRYLAKPYESGGEIHFTSLVPFGAASRNAWWTAYDLAQTAALELREAEIYFFRHPIRPKVTRVAGGPSPRAFAQFVQTNGWDPIETRPTINAVNEVIRRLGGNELYGTDLLVPMRELIQNARDAIVARRRVENKPDSWGTITVATDTSHADGVLTVTDNGIGMSERTMTKYLLDFGTSYWQSDDCLEDFPSLDFEQFSPVGEFGIGFFSVFMLGSKVKVISRTPNDGRQQTRVLEFQDGLNERPVLRPATPDEQLNDAGTAITIELSKKQILRRILTPKHERVDLPLDRVRFRNQWTLAEALAWECPASDVDIKAVEDGRECYAVRASDWLSMEPEQLFRRIFLHREDIDQLLSTVRSAYHLGSIEEITGSDGRVLGRASLIDNLSSILDASGLYGIATCGPFRASMQLLTPGILLGRPTSASRNNAEPLAFQDYRATSAWATKQAEHAKGSICFSEISARAGHAAYVRSLCGDMFDTEVYLNRRKYVSLNCIIASGMDFSEVYIFPLNFLDYGGSAGGLDFDDPSHLGVTMGRMTNGKFLKIHDPLVRSEHPRWRQYWYSLWGAAIEAISIAWNCDLTKLLEDATSVSVEEGSILQPAILRRPG